MIAHQFPRQSTPGRLGATLLETLVVITVLALLAVLILPAVQHARETSRNATCRSHLRQLGIALHGYESARGAYPPLLPAAGTTPRGTDFSDRHYAPHVLLLPYLDQTVIYDTIDLTQPQLAVVDPGDLPGPVREQIAVFLCPSDTSGGGTNFRVCTGETVQSFALESREGGAFSEMRGLSSARFQDGLSNTVAMGERRRSDHAVAQNADEDYWYSGAGALIPDDEPEQTELTIQVCAAMAAVAAPSYPFCGHTWLIAGYEHTWYNHALGPNSSIPDCTGSGWDGIVVGYSSTRGVMGASSRHPGGVHVLFMDGRVSFVNENVDLNLWRAVATRVGREAVNEL